MAAPTRFSPAPKREFPVPGELPDRTMVAWRRLGWTPVESDEAEPLTVDEVSRWLQRASIYRRLRASGLLDA